MCRDLAALEARFPGLPPALLSAATAEGVGEHVTESAEEARPGTSPAGTQVGDGIRQRLNTLCLNAVSAVWSWARRHMTVRFRGACAGAGQALNTGSDCAAGAAPLV
ncbi:hypothetical protein GCM10010121_084780 [Streptomyces brasiliensis]|uniref:Uncharacterized protein n=1 Tax=Streptomyces brasiliensis TaxID=1954 RepID=A0A917UIR2_9ACTN|nr:hypothetical protein GCM10010121_084780 [Streptomyces brasiliensis]